MEFILLAAAIGGQVAVWAALRRETAEVHKVRLDLAEELEAVRGFRERIESCVAAGIKADREGE